MPLSSVFLQVPVFQVSVCAQVSAELPSSPPGGSTWLEEVVDEGETRRSKGSSGATCTGLNAGQVCGAVRGRKRVTLRSRVIEEICGGIHHCRETEGDTGQDHC